MWKYILELTTILWQTIFKVLTFVQIYLVLVNLMVYHTLYGLLVKFFKFPLFQQKMWLNIIIGPDICQFGAHKIPTKFNGLPYIAIKI